jgi:serine phosphatase RsbU (regulator of sigma subunit)
MRKAVSIRQSMLTSIVVLVAVLGGGALLTTVLGARSVVLSLSGALIGKTLDQTELLLRGFFEPVAEELLQVRGWGAAGMLDLDDRETMTDLLQPVMRHHPLLSSILVADETGREFMMMRYDAEWTSRIATPTEGGGSRLEIARWTDDDPTPVRETVTSAYDPTERPWFEGAIETLPPDDGPHAIDDLHWTEPYEFFTTRDPGITTSTSFRTEDGRLHVVGIDITLLDITTFTRGLTVSPGARVFVLTDDRRLIGLPRDRRFDTEEQRNAALLERPDDIGLAVASDAVDAFGGEGDPPPVAVRFHSRGKPWWGQARRVPISDMRFVWAAVLVPESDLIGGTTVVRGSIIAIIVAVLIAGVARSIVLARRFAAPIEGLARESDRIAQGDLEAPPAAPSNIREVRELSDAHDRMRTGLRSLMKLERDLQLARQIQMGTFPDHLPDIPEYEMAALSVPAEETGGDTYDVIGYVPHEPEPGRPLWRASLAPDRANHAVLLLADATGHGIGPALSVTQLRSMLRMAVRLNEGFGAIVKQLNEELCSDLPPGRFITAWLGELNAGEHTLTWFSAGQAPLLRYVAARQEFEVIDADTVPFGIMPDIEMEAPTGVTMEPGDIFIVISDGVYEATSPAGEQFGRARVEASIAAHAHETPEQILEATRVALNAFTHDAPADDDRTAVILKRKA